MTLDVFKKRFDRQLTKAVRRLQRDVRVLLKNRFLDQFIDHAAHLTLADGKRLRPYVAVSMYQACGGKRLDASMDLFVALELFHMFALIQDDVIDRGIIRHGLATLHKRGQGYLEKAHRRGDAAHIANGQAVLVGDLLLDAAWEQLFVVRGFDARRLEAVRHLFHRMTQEVLSGQMIDVDLTTLQQGDRHHIERKMFLKTASYTFVRPLEMGCILAGGDNRARQFCQTFGGALGMAFQLQDDYLDLVSSPRESHKTAFGDLAEHQQTFFTDHIFQSGTSQQRRLLRSLMGYTLTEKDRPRITKLFSSSGSFAAGLKILQRYEKTARQALDQWSVAGSRKQVFADLLDRLHARRS